MGSNPMNAEETRRKILTSVLPALTLAWLAGLATALPASGQWRFGVTGGFPTGLGVVVEYRPWEHNGLELKIARAPERLRVGVGERRELFVSPLNISVAAKQYWGSGDWERHVGAGVTFAFARGQGIRDDGTEFSVGWRPVPLVTVPVGIDWKANRRNTIGLTGILSVRPFIPIPFPELSYRWGSSGDENP